MKIALLTIWHVGNYGAEMQAYATCRVLKELGHEVTLIDFRNPYSSKNSIKQKFANILGLFTISYLKFKHFWSRYLPEKTCYYHSLSELKKHPPQADMYLVGSDQVWNPEIAKENIEAYFLNFGSPMVKRAAYASSFGTSSWSGMQQITDMARTSLKRFQKISCRESSGTKLLHDVFGVDSTTVLDPTLLLDGYPELTGEIEDRRTLVFYPLWRDAELENFSLNLSRELNLEFINNNKMVMLTNSIPFNRLSVENWVRNIAEASFVITRSFHGLAFSLIYQKQFIIINDSDRNVRIKDLLHALNLESRLFKTIDDVKSRKPWLQKINYEDVNIRLNSLRIKSIDYLKQMLQ